MNDIGIDKTYEKIGEVYRCLDTANVIILTNNNGKKKKRFLITSEFVELMEPTDRCYQLSMELLREKLKD